MVHKKVVPEGPWGFGFGLRAFKNFPELIPLVSIIGGACLMGTSFIAYSLYQKPDVTINKTTSREYAAPWERVKYNESQKLLNFNTKFVKNEELENLRKEIGSYKC